MRYLRTALLLIFAALVAAACTDPIAEAPERYTQRLELERAPLEWQYSNRPNSAEAHRPRVALVAARIEREREWCAEQFDDPAAVPEFDSDTATLEWAESAPEEALVWMREVAQKTAARRGLALEAMPSVYIISPESFRTALCPLLLGPEHTEANPLWHLDRLLGNIDPSWNASVMERLRIGGVTAWYAPANENRGGQIVLVNGYLPPRRYLGIFSHEIVHALQDAHFGLPSNAREELGSSDAVDAFAWVVEGDATFSALPWTELQEIVEVPGFEWSDMSGAPPQVSLFEVFPLRGEMIFDAYRRGRAVIGDLHGAAGYDGINRLFTERPASASQVLHPEMLTTGLQPIGREEICTLTPALLGELPCGGYPQSDRLGELFLRTFIAESTGQVAAAREAAEGWRGDLMRFVEGETKLVLWQIAFANQAEHSEAAAELRNWLIAHSGGRARAAIGAPVIAWDGPTAAIRVVDYARMVWLVVSDDPAFADRVVFSILDIDAAPGWWGD